MRLENLGRFGAVLLVAACSSKGGDGTTASGGSTASGGVDSAGGSGGAGTTGGGNTGGVSGGGGSSGAANGTPTTLYLVGDSTVASFNDPYYYPRYGYGTQIGKYLSSAVTVTNLALSGRSSKSFIDPTDSPNYATLKSSLKAGDYLMIGFGHNDEKADASLYTNPNTDVADPASFKYYLYTYYIQPAQAVGAIPILTTPVVRRDAAGNYAGAKVHVTADAVSAGVTYAGGDYPKAIRDLGAAYNVPVIDNTVLTAELGKQIFAASGAAGTANLQAWVSDAITSVDDTHTNIYGAASYAYLIANALKTSASPLKDYVLPNIAPPDASILMPNPNWMPTTYTPPTKSTTWKTTEPWMGTVFGDVGGASKITDGVSFSISETSASPLVASVRSGSEATGVGKIATATDGIAFYFQPIPIAKDFTFSATATVTSVTFTNSQSGFGLMVRDAAWTDVFNAALLSSYVAVGPLKGDVPASAWSSFIRDTAAAKQLTGTTVSSAAVVPAAGSVVKLSIVKVGSTYTCTYGDEAPKAYTIDLNTIDSQYVYAGMFTARAAQIEYSDIALTITN